MHCLGSTGDTEWQMGPNRFLFVKFPVVVSSSSCFVAGTSMSRVMCEHRSNHWAENTSQGTSSGSSSSDGSVCQDSSEAGGLA